MTNRIVFIGAAALILSAASASGQAPTTKQVVISKTVLESMVANKPKSKTTLGAKVGIRRSKVVAAKSPNAAPTSVRQVSPLPARK